MGQETANIHLGSRSRDVQEKLLIELDHDEQWFPHGDRTDGRLHSRRPCGVDEPQFGSVRHAGLLRLASVKSLP
jgi:hypothetical protein